MKVKKQSLVIFGSGGHASVVLDAAEKSNNFEILGFVDDFKKDGLKVAGYDFLGSRKELLVLKNKIGESLRVIVGVGNNAVRKEISLWLSEAQLSQAIVVHPFTSIGRNVEIAEGTVILAGCVVNSNAVIGKYNILNTRSSVDHDCVLGNGVHVAPGVTVCGGVRIGDGCLLGVGSQIIPGVTLGPNTVVGAGATVTRSFHGNGTILGTPAKLYLANDR